MAIEDEPEGGTRSPGPHRAVWEALDRFDEALRDLDEEVRALRNSRSRTREPVRQTMRRDE
jgi:hypothetical protein